MARWNRRKGGNGTTKPNSHPWAQSWIPGHILIFLPQFNMGIQKVINEMICTPRFPTLRLSYLAQAKATRAAAAFSFCFCGICWPEADVSSSHEQSKDSMPLRQSTGSLVKLKGWQSRRQVKSTSAVMLQREGSVLLWDSMRGKTRSSPIREVKGACSGCCNRPCRLSKARASSSPEFSRSCCSSKASWRWAFQSPRRAFKRYSSRRA